MLQIILCISVFNIDNVHNNKNINLNDQQNSIKYRLRNTKKSGRYKIIFLVLI